MTETPDDFNPFRVQAKGERDKKWGPVGLGGWLILVAIVLVAISTIRVYFLFETTIPIFTDGTWEKIKDPKSDQYKPFLDGAILFETYSNGMFLIAEVALFILFFLKSKSFPKLCIWVCFLRLLFLAVDGWLLFYLGVPFKSYLTGQLAGYIAFICVNILLVLYLWSSDRVDNTFVR